MAAGAVGLALAAIALISPPRLDGATAISLISHGPRSVPVVALTIDDGWSSANCLAMARILAEKHATATFFPVGRAVAASPDTWRRIAAMGFPIGNHTYSHRDLTNLTAAEVAADVASVRALVEGVTGRPMIRVLRPPYGAWDGAVLTGAAAAGFPTTVLWDASFADTARKPDSSHVRSATGGTYGSVVLLHCGPASSVRILSDVIDAYRARGMELVTVPQLLRLIARPESYAGFARAAPGTEPPTATAPPRPGTAAPPREAARHHPVPS